MAKKRIALLSMGLTILLWGWLATSLMNISSSPRLLWLLCAATCGIWVVMAFFAEDILENTVQAVLFLNLPLLIALILFCVNIFAGPFLPHGLQHFLGLFFLPALGRYLDNALIFYELPLPLPQVISAALLLAASLAGCNIRRYGRTGIGI